MEDPVNIAIEERVSREGECGAMVAINFHGGCSNYKKFRKCMSADGWEKLALTGSYFSAVPIEASKRELTLKVKRTADKFVDGMGGSTTVVVTHTSRHDQVRSRRTKRGRSDNPVNVGSIIAARASSSEVDVHPFWIGYVHAVSGSNIELRWLTPRGVDGGESLLTTNGRLFRFEKEASELWNVPLSSVINTSVPCQTIGNVDGFESFRCGISRTVFADLVARSD